MLSLQNAYLIVLTAYLIISAWQDLKTRLCPTSLGIGMLLLLSAIATYSLEDSSLPIIKIAIQSLIIASILAVITTKMTNESFKESFPYSIGVFAPILYVYSVLLNTANPVLPFMLFVPGMLMWYVPINIKHQLQAKIPYSGLMWSILCLAVIITAGSFLMTYVEPAVRIVFLINFLMPIYIKSSTGIGEGDLLLIWLITGSLIYFGESIFAGYSMLLYAILAMFVFFPVRAYFHLIKLDKKELAHSLRHEYMFYAYPIIIGSFIASQFLGKDLAAVITNTDSSVMLITGCIALIFATAYLFIAVYYHVKKQSDQRKPYYIMIVTAVVGYALFQMLSFVLFALVTCFFLYVLIEDYSTYYRKEEEGNSFNYKLAEKSVAVLVVALLLGKAIELSMTQSPAMAHMITLGTPILYLAGIYANIAIISQGVGPAIRFFPNRRKNLWDSISEQLNSISQTASEAYALEITAGFLIVMWIGTPASLVIKYLM
jgi:hypothetical protein